MGGSQVTLAIDKKEFDLWAKHLRTDVIRRAQIRALRHAGYRVREAERDHIKRVFNKRPSTGSFVANAMRYEVHAAKREVWVGAFRKLKDKTGKEGKTGRNAFKIIDDHILGESFTGSSSRPRGSNAARLREKSRVALPAKALAKTRGSTGNLNLKHARRGLSAKKVLGSAKPLTDDELREGKKNQRQGFIVNWKISGKKEPWVAVRSHKQMGNGWGVWMGRTAKGKAKHRPKGAKGRLIASKWPYVIPLFVLKQRAKVKRSIRFEYVARRVGQAALTRAMEKEFARGLKVSNALGLGVQDLS